LWKVLAFFTVIKTERDHNDETGGVMGRAEITKDKYLKSIKISHNIYENQLDPALEEVEFLRPFGPAISWDEAHEREKAVLRTYFDSVGGIVGAQLGQIIYEKEGMK